MSKKKSTHEISLEEIKNNHSIGEIVYVHILPLHIYRNIKTQSLDLVDAPNEQQTKDFRI